MSWINTGAYVNGVRPKTKKALKEALTNAPETVTFDKTAHGDSGTLTVDDVLASTDALSIAGPDPFNKRSWFAAVTASDKHKGRVVCL